MSDIVSNILKTPVTSALIASMVGLFLSGSDKLIDCNNTGNLYQQLLHSFIHANWMHLLINMYSLYVLRYLELSYGSINYTITIGLILVLSSLIQTLIAKLPYWPFESCSVGFSAVILGLIVFDRLNINQWVIDGNQLKYMAILLIIPVIRNPRTSLTGHLSGIIAGIILAMASGLFGIKL